VITLTLFNRGDSSTPIAEKLLGAGQLVVGRDVEADWMIDDPSLTISRRHCVIAYHGGRLTLRDTSANGVFLGAAKVRAHAGAATQVEVGETLHLGDFLIAIGQQEAPSIPCVPGKIGDGKIIPLARKSAPSERPTAMSPATGSDGTLFDAFCEGAGLDPSSFSAEDCAQVMRRTGEAYGAMVRGLAELISEKTTVKNACLMDGTTLGSEGNNPFRWASPPRVALDLLRIRGDGFLSGAEAVEAAFDDLKKHVICTTAAMHAALSSTLARLSPNAVESRTRGGSVFLKKRPGAAWRAYVEMHEELRRATIDDPAALMQSCFGDAYLDKWRELQSASARV